MNKKRKAVLAFLAATSLLVYVSAMLEAFTGNVGQAILETAEIAIIWLTIYAIYRDSQDRA